MTLTPHSIIHGDACFAYFNKIWGIPMTNDCAMLSRLLSPTSGKVNAASR
jgi:hypothetical protein